MEKDLSWKYQRWPSIEDNISGHQSSMDDIFSENFPNFIYFHNNRENIMQKIKQEEMIFKRNLKHPLLLAHKLVTAQ